MDTSVSDAPVGRLLSGRYRVQGRIARGGMATVYEAVDVRLERPVALKVMHPDLAEDAGFVSRFIAEARSAAQLSHPDVVAVYDQGEDDGWVYLAMELVRGRTLRAVLRERGRLDPRLTLEVVAHVLGALDEAHRVGIVHRDIKPENVLVARDGRVKVADFGLARAVSGTSSTTTRGALLGTVAYLSPEQALGEQATRRSDVYSTGVMTYELLTGRPPHQDATDYLVVRRHIEHDVAPPSAAVPDVPSVIDAMVRTATARDPNLRYQDAGEFLAAVRHARSVLAGTAASEEQDGSPRPWQPPEPEVPDAEATGRAEHGEGIQHTVPQARAPRGWHGTGPLAGVGSPAGHDDRRRPARAATQVTDATRSVGAQPGASAAASGAHASQGEPPSPGVRRPRRRALPGVLVVLLLAVAVCGAAYWYGWGRYATAPSVLGLSTAQASRTLQDAGFAPVLVTPGYSETVPQGRVVSTDPAPGDRLLPESSVQVVVSRGPERFAVPRLTGLSVDEATRVLARRSLVLGTQELSYDDTTPQGRIVSQATASGSPVRRGTAVPVVVSRGPRPVTVPSVTGDTATDAAGRLERLGLRVGSSSAYSDTVEQGRVISQDPRDGRLRRGDTVRLVVSRGPRTVVVPAVEGGDATAATAELERLGLRARVVTFLPGGPGRVLRAAPGRGTELRRGSTVTLYVF